MGLDIAGGDVGRGTPFYAGQTITITSVLITPSDSKIEGLLSDGNYLMILHAQSSPVVVGQTVSWGQQLGAVGEYGLAIGSHIHFQIMSPAHTVGAEQDWTDISPLAELLWPAPPQVATPSWYLNYNIPPSNPNPLIFNYGFGGAIPIVGDWCGNGIKSNGVFSAGHWYLYCGPRQDTGSGPGPGNLGPNAFDFLYGATTDMPVVGDWTGKGYDSIGVVGITFGGIPACPQQGWQLEWRLRNSNTSGGIDYDFCYGVPGDWPLVGNWTGVVNRVTQLYIDGVGVARPNRATPTPSLDWYLKAPVSGHAWGGTADVAPFTYPSQPMPAFAADIPVVGDWSGVCRTGIGVVRPGSDYGTLNWLLRSADATSVSPGPPTFSTFAFGNPTDSRVPGAWRLGYFANCLYDRIGVAQ